MRTFTLILGSSSSLSLLTEHSSSPTLRVFRCTTCFGMLSVLPGQVLFGRASQVIRTGSFSSSPPRSGSSMNARTRTLCKSAISARDSPTFTKLGVFTGREYKVPSAGAVMRPCLTFSSSAATSFFNCSTCNATWPLTSFTLRSNSCFAAVSRVLCVSTSTFGLSRSISPAALSTLAIPTSGVA